MTRFGMTLLCLLRVVVTSAAADNLIEPGQWKVTATTTMWCSRASAGESPLPHSGASGRPRQDLRACVRHRQFDL